MKLDFLFPRSVSEASWQDREEPQLGPADERPARRLPDLPGLPAPADQPAVPGRLMSPRQLASWAHEMYLSGALSWEEYALAGFPAELHPGYNRTVGALTGQRAQPDTPRDMIKEWEDRLAFARRHARPLDTHIRRTEKILGLLRRVVGGPEKKWFRM